MLGCTNPAAHNYNPSATEDDGSCIYVNRYNNACYRFEDAPDQGTDRSFTMSFSFTDQGWVFFHDYLPDFYFHTKENLYNIKNNEIYKQNAGPAGVYHTPAVQPFFIDLVVKEQQDFMLNSVQWVSEVLENGKEKEFNTITHITVWNTDQCSMRIPVTQLNSNNLKGVWSFNDLFDYVKEKGTSFLEDIFNNFAVIPSAVDVLKPWWTKAQLTDKWCIIRLEFDNLSGNEFILHDAGVNEKIAVR